MTDDPRPEATQLEEKFPMSYAIFAMARVHRAVAAAKLAEFGLFPNQEIMIVQLSTEDGVPQKVLARTLRVSHVTVAKTVARMERAGFVERRASTEDRRMTLVFLTDAGRALRGRILDVWSELESATTAGQSPRARAAFVASAQRIRAELDSVADEVGRW